MEDIYQLEANYCRVFSDPKRLRIIWALKDGEKTVTELADAIDSSLPNVSQHLRIMRQVGVLTKRRDGRSVYYAISNDKFLDACRIIRNALVEEIRKKGEVNPVDS